MKHYEVRHYVALAEASPRLPPHLLKFCHYELNGIPISARTWWLTVGASVRELMQERRNA